ncbi:hypothetical protein D3C87_1493260 [compost metagenome]
MVVIACRFDIEAERRKSCHMRFNSTSTKVAAASKRELEVFVLVEKWAEEHDNGARSFSSFDIHVFELKTTRWNDFKIISVVNPADLNANTLQYFNDTINLFDACNAAQCSFTFIKKSGAE